MSEQLPPTNTPVLISTSDGTVCAAEMGFYPESNKVYWDGVGFGGYEWDWDWDSPEEPWNGVLAWRPLPAPYEKGEQ